MGLEGWMVLSTGSVKSPRSGAQSVPLKMMTIPCVPLEGIRGHLAEPQDFQLVGV